MLDVALKIVQGAFYIVAGCVAVLTYIKAKKTLLNTVNTEYNKHVINRLAELAEELFSEFDPNSGLSWREYNIVNEHFEAFCSEYEDFKKRFPKQEPDDEWFPGVPVSRRNMELRGLERKVRSDPFIPQAIRLEVLRYLNGRMSVLHGAETVSHKHVIEHQLKQDRPLERSDAIYGIHNIVNDYQYEHGFGISQCEERVESIRLAIQKHFEAYDPML